MQIQSAPAAAAAYPEEEEEQARLALGPSKHIVQEPFVMVGIFIGLRVYCCRLTRQILAYTQGTACRLRFGIWFGKALSTSDCFKVSDTDCCSEVSEPHLDLPSTQSSGLIPKQRLQGPLFWATLEGGADPSRSTSTSSQVQAVVTKPTQGRASPQAVHRTCQIKYDTV